MERAVSTNWSCGSTIFKCPMASAMSTASMRPLRKQTIFPKLPWAIRSTAATPKRVPRMRSNGVGEPPRWMCPSTLTRTSLLASVAMAFPIRFPTAPARRFSLSSGGNIDAFRDDHNREALPITLSLSHKFADILNGERNFRNENYVSTPRDAGLERNPARVTAHDLDHHDAVMRFSRSVDFVDGISRGGQRRVKSERHLGS